jgi:hypothetical protein
MPAWRGSSSREKSTLLFPFMVGDMVNGSRILRYCYLYIRIEMRWCVSPGWSAYRKNIVEYNDFGG